MIRPDFCGDHQLRDRLRGEERALEIDIDRVVEILLRDVFREIFRADADIVDEHVDAPEFFMRLGHAGADRLQIGQIHFHGKSTPAEAFYFGRQRRAVGGFPDADNDVRSRSRAGERTGVADAARRAGHQNRFAFKVKSWRGCRGHE